MLIPSKANGKPSAPSPAPSATDYKIQDTNNKQKTQDNMIARRKRSTKDIVDFAKKNMANLNLSGEYFHAGYILPPIVKDLKDSGISVESKDVVILDSSIAKYRNHPKQAKGAVVDPADMTFVLKALQNPTSIYQDEKNGRLIYVQETPLEEDKVVKAVVHVNYFYKGSVFNCVKSWGIVEKTNMNEGQYRLIYKKKG